MQREREVVAAHRREGRCRVPGGVLGADRGREEEEAVVDGVAEEAQHVGRLEIDAEAGGRAPAYVEERLRVEGQGPAGEALESSC